jgi:pimeloyl-ACP methyl ester carboxylesterase
MALDAPEVLTAMSARVQVVAERWIANGPELGCVVLLPGGGQTRHSWDRSAAALQAKGWTAITVDLRGHGDSGWDPTGDYAVGTIADDLITVLPSFVPSAAWPPVLVGASLGGLAALVAAGRAPGYCRGLVLVDITLRVEPAGRDRIRAFMNGHPEGFATVEEAGAVVADYRSERPRPVNLDRLSRNLRLGADGRWRWHWDPEILHQDHDSVDPMHPARVHLRDAARAVKAPVLLVHGLSSDVVSDEGVEEAMSLLADASVAAIPDGTHMIVGDDNAAFLGVIEDFLARTAASGGRRDPTEQGDASR